MADYPLDGHPVEERVRYLQAVFAEEVVNLSPEEKRSQGVNDDTPRRRAIEQVAQERGCTPHTVRNILAGWKKKLEKQTARAAEFAIKRQTTIETYGAELTDEWLSAYYALQRDMHQALYFAGQARKLIAKLENSEWYPKGGLKHALGRIAELKKALEDAQPIGICPYCKQVEAVMAECAPCFTKGILLDGQMKHVPPRYFSMVLPQVLYRGQDRPLCEFQPEAEQQELL